MKFLSDILARAGLVVDGTVTLNSVANATTDTDRFIVVDSGVVKYRTGTQLLSDIGGISGNQTITLSGDATGSGTTAIAVTLANSGVVAGTYGSASAVPVITVDAKGRVTGVTTASISVSLTFTGDVTGTGTTGSSTTLTLANSGVTAGTYNNVTVNAKGLVTSGSNVSYLTSYTETDTLASVTGRGASTSTVVTFSGGDTNNSSVKLAGYNQRGGAGFHGFLEATNTFGSATNPNKYFRLDSVGSLQIINSAYTVAILTLTNAGDLSVPGSVTAGSFIRSGGTSSQFLKADGSVDSSTYATQTFVNTQISNLVNSAPAALDTLNELAAALGNDANFSTTVSTALGNRLRIDINNQGLTSTQRSNGRTNLGVVIGTDVQAWDADLDAIAALAGTSGFLRKTAANTWTLDTNTYLTSYTETDTLATVTGRGATTTAQITVDSVITNNNGNGTNLRIGDDAWIGDINLANTFRVQGVQNAANAYIVFGNGDSTALGRAGTGALTYGGNTVYHAGNLTNLNQLTNGPGYITGNQNISFSGDVSGNGTTTISTTVIGLRGALLPTTGVTAGFLRWTGATGTWVLDSGAYLTGNQTITLSGDVTGSGTTAITVTLANSGVTAGTYNNVTVDAKGRVTSGSNVSYLTSYTETDTLATVTGRGATTSTAITINSGGNVISTSTWEKWRLVTTGVTAPARQGSDANGLNFTSNALWNSGWSQDDSTRKSFAYIQHLGNGRHEFRTSASGGTISWVTGLTIDESAANFNVPLSISSNLVATQTWVQSQGYLTSVSDVWVNNSGDSMTGNLSFGSSGAGLTWAANTDGASITFESTGDGASGGRALSNLLIALTDNGDEGLKVTSASAELLYVNTNQFQYKGNTVWHSANDGSGSGLDADLLDGINSGSFLRSDVVGATVTGTILSTNNANVDGPNFDVNTTNKTVNEYAYRVSRSGSAVGGILIDGRGAFASGTTVNGSTVWHQGNLTNLNQLTNGPGYITPNSTVSGWIAFQANTQGTPIIRAVQQDTTSGFYLFQGVTGSTEVFRIDRSGTGYFAGNLGIGTASPSARLDVNGENRATSFTNAGTLGTGANNARNHFTQLNAGNAIPATGWIASAFGDALADRIVIGQWTNGSQQAIFGAHNSNLTAWADTHYVSINHLFYGNGAWSSTPAMVINSSQNVGINTASPSAKLNISGISSGTSIRTDHTASYSILYSYINGASPIAFDNTSGNLDVFVGGTPRLRVGTGGQLRLHAYTSSSAFTGTAVATLAVDSSGNVITVTGVGSESDTLATVTNRGNTTTGRINVRGAGNQSGGNILMGNTGNATAKWSYLTGAHYNADTQTQGFSLIGGYSDASGNRVVIGGSIYESNPATEIQFWTHTATTHNLGGTQRGVIDSSGNWGIGTNTSANKLQIGSVGSSGYGGNDLAIGNGTGVMAFYQTNTVSTWYTNTNFSLMPAGAGGVGNLAIGTATASNRLTVSGSADITGNLGIGVANPAVRLDVNGSVYVRTGVLYLDTIAGYTSGVITLNSSTNLIIPSGRVGIGLTNPDAILDVSHTAGTTNIIRVSNGSGNYRWRVDQNFNMYMTNASGVDTFSVTTAGALTATSITETSTIKIKENIAPVTAALDKVDQLKPVSYNKKGSATKEIGLIAEDVFDVYPEFVLCDDNGEPVGIHYSRLTAVLIESVKELKKEINELKNRN